MQKSRSSAFILAGLCLSLPLFSHAAQPLDPHADAPGAYFSALQQEFSAVGPARIVFGDHEDAICSAIETGGGMEKFFLDRNRTSLREFSTVEDKPFARACSFSIQDKPAKYWDKSFRLVNTQPLHKGETLLAVFWAKGVKVPQVVDDGAGATLQAYFQSNIGKFPKGRVNNFYDCKMLGTDWQRYTIKTPPLSMDFPPGSLALVGMLGHKAQTVDVGGLAVLAFPADADLSALPRPSWDYPGRSPDAPWRQEAEQRIDKFRKGNLTITVRDANGQPAANTKVHLNLRRHAFRFGVAIRAGTFQGNLRGMTPDDVNKYREITTNHYTGIVLENALKWNMFEAERATNWQNIKQCLSFYQQQGMWIRGHVLVWPTIYRTPEPIKSQFMEKISTIGPTVLAHIREAVTEFKPWIDDWDVTNETDVNRDFMDHLGPQAMVDWYRTAREAAAPGTMLTFNEPGFGAAGMEIGSFPEELLRKDCRGWVDYLIQNGAPLDVLGSQCHGGTVSMDYAGKTGAEALWAYYDRLASYYGKKLQYTELDVNIGDPSDPDQQAYQADKLRDTILIAFAHPAFIGVTQWGFWAGSHYAPNAALWNHDWSIRPVGQAYLDLVEKRWHTEAELITDAKGSCTLRAFYGTYDIVVGEEKTVISFDFPTGNQRIEIHIESGLNFPDAIQLY